MNATENSVSSEPIEAVIISGPRKGEIVHLNEGLADVSPQDIEMINEALDQLNAALDRLSQEFRASTAAMRAQTETR